MAFVLTTPTTEFEPSYEMSSILSDWKAEDYASPEEIKKQLMKITSRKYNKKCADCSRKESFHVVLKFSIFICGKCCAHHSKLGHRIKSIHLDDFNDTDVKMLRTKGNKKSNKKFLYKYSKLNVVLENQQYIFI
eukprot:UN13384